MQANHLGSETYELVVCHDFQKVLHGAPPSSSLCSRTLNHVISTMTNMSQSHFFLNVCTEFKYQALMLPKVFLCCISLCYKITHTCTHAYTFIHRQYLNTKTHASTSKHMASHACTQMIIRVETCSTHKHTHMGKNTCIHEQCTYTIIREYKDTSMHRYTKQIHTYTHNPHHLDIRFFRLT